MDADQLRMARAAIDITASELAKQAGVGRNTVIELEKRRRSQPHERIRQEIIAFLERFVVFVEATEDHGPGVMLRSGMIAGCWRERPKNGTEPEPLDEDAAKILEYWKDRPEDWKSLPEETQFAMLLAIYGSVPEVDPISA